MTEQTKKSEALLDIALVSYKEEIQPGLPSEKRYTAAMIANALGMAQRRLESEDPGKALLTELGGETLHDIARDIRAGAISDETHGGLADTLLDYLTAELHITNPRFLKRRLG